MSIGAVLFIFFVSRNAVEASQGMHLDLQVVNAKSQNLLQQISGQVSALQERIEAAMVESAESIRVQAAAYETQLQSERSAIAELERQHSVLLEATETIESSNRELRRAADNLTISNDALMSDLSALQHNLSVAQEYTSSALEHGEAESASVELAVLRELGGDEVRDIELPRSELALNSVDGSTQDEITEGAPFSRGTALLQVAAHMPTEETMLALLKPLESSLDQVAKEEKQTRESLETRFKEELTGLLKKKAEIANRNSRLNATLTSEMELNGRLEAAVDYLANLHESLLHSSKALRLFGARLGAVPLVGTIDRPIKSKRAVLLNSRRVVKKAAPLPFLQTAR